VKDNTTKNGKEQSQAFAKTDPAPTADTNQASEKSTAPKSAPKADPSGKNARQQTSKT